MIVEAKIRIMLWRLLNIFASFYKKLQYARDLLQCFVFTIISILLASAMTFVTEKGILILLTIVMSYTFSYAWDKGKKYFNSGSFEGRVLLPKIPLNYEYNVSLREIYGEKRYYDIEVCNNRFKITRLNPNKYELIVSGRYLNSIKKEIEIYSKYMFCLDSISPTVLINNVWSQINTLPIIIYQTYIDPNGGIWIYGSNTKNSKNEYCYSKDIAVANWSSYDKCQFYDLLYSLFGDEILMDSTVLGEIGREIALKHIDRGSWKPISDVSKEFLNGVKVNSELTLGFFKREGKTIIHRSIDNGISWEEVAELSVNQSVAGVTGLSSGRIVIFTQSLYDNAAIYYSDDLGVSWLLANASVKEKIRAFLSVYQMKNGEVIASTLSGDGCKGDFCKSALILRSSDNGANWDVIHELKGMKSYCSFYESNNGILFSLLSSGEYLVASFDNGMNWHSIPGWPAGNKLPILKQFCIVGNKIYVYGNLDIYFTNLDNLNLDIK